MPVAEIDDLSHFWKNYEGLRETVFTPRSGDTTYADFSPAVTDRRALAAIVKGSIGMAATHARFLEVLEAWWKKNLPLVENLAPKDGQRGNVYALRRQLLTDIAETFTGQNLLTDHQVRGAFARYVDDLKADLKSVAASGWGPELIPDEDIIQSQFPELLAEMEQKRLRLAELETIFVAADEDDYEDGDDTGVLPSEQVKTLREEIKELRAQTKASFEDLKAVVVDLIAELKVAGKLDPGTKKSTLTVKGTYKAPDFASGATVVDLARTLGFSSERMALIQEHIANGTEIKERLQVREQRLARHKALEDEAKKLKSDLRANETKKEELVSAARTKIDRDQARRVILDRLRWLIVQRYEGYLRADQRACLTALENLHAKYAVTAKIVEAKRDLAAEQLEAYLGGLGYA